jgi:transcriptional regulator
MLYTQRSDKTYSAADESDVTRLIVDHPLAWIVSAGSGDVCATLVPLRPVTGANNEVVALLGHLARSNPHVELLRRQPEATALFLGPHAYVSPSWMQDRTLAPTWNYVSAQYVVDVELLSQSAQLDEVITDLVDAMEKGRPGAWSAQEMGSRYEKLARGIVAFRAHPRSRRVKFKLGQDERPEVYPNIVSGLSAEGRDDILEWMANANAHRGVTE